MTMRLPDSPETLARKQRERDLAENEAFIRKIVEQCRSAVSEGKSSPDFVSVDPILKRYGDSGPINYSRREIRAVLDTVNGILRPSGWRLVVHWFLGMALVPLADQRENLPIATDGAAEVTP